MDHLPLPRHPLRSPILVPLVSDIVLDNPVRAASFVDHIMSSGLDPVSLDNHHYSPERLDNVVQAWLIFGVFWACFGASPCAPSQSVQVRWTYSREIEVHTKDVAAFGGASRSPERTKYCARR